MTEQERERLSALVDGELARAHEVRAVDAVLGDDDERQRWDRYHLIGAALRAEAHGAGGDLAARVRSALEIEPVAQAPRRAPVSRARLAIAASFVVAVVAGAWVLQRGPDGEPTTEIATRDDTRAATQQVVAAVTADSPSQSGLAAAVDAEELADEISRARTVDLVDAAGGMSTLAGATVAGSGSRWPSTQGTVPRRLSDYLVSHNERGAMTGMHPYARIVAYPDAFR